MTEARSRARGVFLNHPFDRNYVARLRPALVFSVIYCGFQARSADEKADSGVPRLSRIYKLMKGCRLSIHDFSRPCRFNMPFEYGVCIGLRESGRWPAPTLLAVAESREQFRKNFSDLAGIDLVYHGNDPLKLLVEVRDFIDNHRNDGFDTPSPHAIRTSFERFYRSFPRARKAFVKTRGDGDLKFAHLEHIVRGWLKENEQHMPLVAPAARRP